ncbi:DUF6193 family natural product biosynthesis protein [Streptomyces sparsogenes]|uniref:DUF6193 family natural product biosynthesis protein n=1 Tax=Streptomyces sparsogenes TaxID=67365 RepID=UPI003D9E22F9
MLRFSTTTRPRLAVVGPSLTANSDNTYGVGRGVIGQDLGRFATVHEAVALAVRQLPSGLGPTTFGGYPARHRSSGPFAAAAASTSLAGRGAASWPTSSMAEARRAEHLPGWQPDRPAGPAPSRIPMSPRPPVPRLRRRIDLLLRDHRGRRLAGRSADRDRSYGTGPVLRRSGRPGPAHTRSRRPARGFAAPARWRLAGRSRTGTGVAHHLLVFVSAVC